MYITYHDYTTCFTKQIKMFKQGNDNTFLFFMLYVIPTPIREIYFNFGAHHLLKFIHLKYICSVPF